RAPCRCELGDAPFRLCELPTRRRRQRYPPQLRPGLLRPQRGPELLEQRGCAAERIARRALALRAAFHATADELRPGEVERHLQPLVALLRLFERGACRLELSACG